MMNRDEIVGGLRWLKPESGDFICEGCGWENNCDVRGCRIVREAADMLENDATHFAALERSVAIADAASGLRQDAIEKWKKAYGTLRAKYSALLEQNGKLRDAAADVTRLAAEAAVERDWISVEDRLPEEHESIFAKAYGTKRWADGMFRTISDEVLACVAFEDGHKMTMTLRTHDGAWALSSIHRGHVTHWMPLPEPPEEEK